jgi:hypothetical protein
MADSVVIGVALAHRIGYGGHAWAMLQYVLGFRQLGFDVTVVDRLEPGMVDDADYGRAVRYLRKLLEPEDVPYALFDGTGATVAGLSRERALANARNARFLLNVMGFVTDPELLETARKRVFLDIDPGFGQVWWELGLADPFAGHDVFVTVGRNVGSKDCEVPTCGLTWLTMAHPVVLERAARPPGGGDAYTSIGSWRGPYDAIEFRGRKLGLRAHEFRRFASLPRRVDVRVRVALEMDNSDGKDIALLRGSGWTLVDPKTVAANPHGYVRFVAASRAELTVAKGMYVELQSGWLGDRTVCYLAHGRPALVQDTGLGAHYPLGEGLLTFRTLDELADGVRHIEGDYAAHADAARALAEHHFDARRVLGHLVEAVGR